MLRSAPTDKPSISIAVVLPCGLSMESVALGIDERRLDHFGVDDLPQVVDAYLLAQPLRPSRQHAEGNRSTQLGTPIARGHMAFGLRRRSGGRDLRAHRQRSPSVHGRQRHQLESIAVARRGPKQRASAYEIRGLALEVSCEADILRQSRPIGVVADIYEALSGALDFHSFASLA